MKRAIVNVFFVLLWTVMALVLFVAGALVCSVKLLSPDKLTPIVSNFANKALDARVNVGRVELSFEPAFPVLRLQIDSLEIISEALKAGDRAALPAYSDTLFTLQRFDGGVDLLPLLTRGEIAVGDVKLVRPALNIVLDREGRGNFDIYRAADGEADDTDAVVIPPFSISRFSFVEPREIRYFNAVDSAEASVLLLSEAYVDGRTSPRYVLKADGQLGGPFAKLINIDNVRIGLDGKVRWEPQRPEMLALEDFTIYGAFLRATLATELIYDSTLVVNSAELRVNPFAVTDVLQVLPSEMLKEYRLIKPFFDTDATIAANVRIDRPFRAAADSIPWATVNVEVPECSMHYGKADIRSLIFEGTVELRGNDADSARVNIRRFHVAGPATSLDFSGDASQLISDPAFDVTLKGDIDLRQLPPVLTRFIPGSLTGRLNFSLNAEGTASMFHANRFHRLDVRGKLDGKDLYFLSEDTARMAVVDGLGIRFGSQIRGRDKSMRPSLGAMIKVDTASVLIDGVSINASALSLGAGVENSAPTRDTTVVVPVGGGLKIGRLSVRSITDSAGVYIRGLLGRVGVQRYEGNRHMPLIKADLNLDRISAGSKSTRFNMRDAGLHATTYLNPARAKRMKEIKHLSDSIQRRHPELSPDSVMRLAIEKRRANRGRKRRVRTEMTAEDTEIIEWDLSNGLRKYMTNWVLEGTLATDRARLLTPYFPLRNEISHLDIKFSTDSVLLNGMRYKAGHTDLNITGLISDIRRSLLSRTGRNRLKINFDINSDTIDVNQLAAAAFAGSAYAESLRRGAKGIDMDMDESKLEQQLDAMASQKADTVGPLLVPTNIDATLSVRAGKLIYSDLDMKHLSGDMLVYDGAVNLHNLSAISDAGSMSLSALYYAPKPSDMQFGLGLELARFRIERFLTLVPAVDSIMPMLRDFSGIIDANIAATVDIDSCMNLELPTLDAAIRLTGDSLALINPETYATLGKWLRFRDRADNKIKHMNVEMLVRDNMLQLFPFSFDIDRYRLGVLGHNDLAMNFNYHISVLKSPLPFRFGITIKGNPDKYKIRLGGAKFKDNMVAENVNIVDTARVNLVRQIENVFRRGVSNSRFAKINVASPDTTGLLDGDDSALTAADSTMLIREGLLEAPPEQQTSADSKKEKKKKGGKNKDKKSKENSEAVIKKD